jgi:hypothetical protein
MHGAPSLVSRSFGDVLPFDVSPATARTSRLADYKVPETVSLSNVPLPRNANGKVLKPALRDMDRS